MSFVSFFFIILHSLYYSFCIFLFISFCAQSGRRQIIVNLMKKQGTELSEEDIESLCTLTDGIREEMNIE